ASAWPCSTAVATATTGASRLWPTRPAPPGSNSRNRERDGQDRRQPIGADRAGRPDQPRGQGREGWTAVLVLGDRRRRRRARSRRCGRWEGRGGGGGDHQGRRGREEGRHGGYRRGWY